MSIAIEVCRIAEQQALAAGPGAGSVVAVGVDVGESAGVELSSLTFCLETLLADPPFAGAKPVIRRSPGDVLRVSYIEVDDGRPND
ncbi:MAG TPA: hydrogenase/urease maturation nickel metallochaperone HypA [Gemmatimonadales bacterium]|nr:hydrogenase/urease maturation nickel metallochaperone HypA [Gemmatimonadales bacterium]